MGAQQVVLATLVAAAAAMAAMTAVACDAAGRGERGAAPPPVDFDTSAVRIVTDADTFDLTVELAETADQRSYGLMERPRMPEDHGMLFLYAERQDSTSGFWMYRTLIPLDVAFLDEDGRIVAIRRMEPCESPYAQSCPVYSPGEPYASALEVNAGYFEARGIGVGDRVVVRRDADG